MIEAVILRATAIWNLIPFSSATWVVLFMLWFFLWLFAKASKDPRSIINWEHLIVDSENNRASPYKLGYIVGLIIGTWIVVTFADTGKLTYDILGVYLTFLVGGAGINSFAKKNQPYTDDRIPHKRPLILDEMDETPNPPK